MTQRLIWVLWPGFLIAIPTVGVVFTLLDPAEMHLFGEPLQLSRLGAYTIGFVFFWIMGSAASAVTCLLQRSPFEVNRCPLPAASRPPGCPKRDAGGCA